MNTHVFDILLIALRSFDKTKKKTKKKIGAIERQIFILFKILNEKDVGK